MNFIQDEALNNEELGKDLRSVQALQRTHEGLERDLAALGDKINLLDEKDSNENVYEKQKVCCAFCCIK